MTVELYRVHRPTDLDELVGQDEIVEMVEAMIEDNKIPHAILATGPSGTGKTTTFRIMRNRLGCSDLDFREVNVADFRGIDMVREIRQAVGLSPMNGKVKVWLIDECHQLTSEAQEALLKLLEDTPAHVYFFLASTHPQKLKPTIITRCTHLKFRALQEGEIAVLVSSIYKKETKEKLPTTIANKLAEMAEGSARKALVMLHQIIGLDLSEEEKILDCLKPESLERESIEICRALLNNRTSWKEMAAILKGVKEDPEQLRWMILGYMKSVALSGSPVAGRACGIIDEFRENFFDSKLAGLVASCYNVVSQGD